jgi:hypothetical protein
MRCAPCEGEGFVKAGRDRQRRHLYRCKPGGRHLAERSQSACRGDRFPEEVIALAVRGYLR